MLRVLTALLCLLVLTPPAVAADARPNILFLFTDDQRADTVGVRRDGVSLTPNADALAARGTTFTRAYCMGAQQGAVCVPSRAMLMSGLSLYRVKESLQNTPTWPEAFGQSGYQTFATGKWHNGMPSLVRSFKAGKSIFMGGMGDPYKLQVNDLSAGPDGGRQLTNKRATPKHSCELFADAAVEFLATQRERAEPFLCYVSFNLPHDPRVAPKSFHDAQNPAKPPVPPNFLPVHPFNNGELVIRDERLAPWPRTEAVVRQHLADYYAAVSFVDLQVGRILSALKESGKLENTIVVFTSDHGLAIGSHGLMGKQNVYDHSMRSPLIIAGPGVAQGKTTDAMCYLFDLFPTLADLAGVKGPDCPDAVRLRDLLTGKTSTARPAILTGYRDVQRAVRDDRWKLIVYPKINKVQLFDLQADPHETKDLSADVAHEAELSRMMALLKSQQQSFGDGTALRSDKPLPAEFDFSKVKPVNVTEKH
jgi:arylsulfatase A-like enzyme